MKQALARSLLIWFGVIPVVHGLVPCLISRLTPRLRRRPVAASAAGTSNLVIDGPYGISRNPVHVAYLALWPGWSIFLGSAAVAAGFVVLCGVASRLIVPIEERELAARFGTTYAEYKRRVPRWLGKGTS